MQSSNTNQLFFSKRYPQDPRESCNFRNIGLSFNPETSNPSNDYKQQNQMLVETYGFNPHEPTDPIPPVSNQTIQKPPQNQEEEKKEITQEEQKNLFSTNFQVRGLANSALDPKISSRKIFSGLPNNQMTSTDNISTADEELNILGLDKREIKNLFEDPKGSLVLYKKSIKAPTGVSDSAKKNTLFSLFRSLIKRLLEKFSSFFGSSMEELRLKTYLEKLDRVYFSGSLGERNKSFVQITKHLESNLLYGKFLCSIVIKMFEKNAQPEDHPFKDWVRNSMSEYRGDVFGTKEYQLNKVRKIYENLGRHETFADTNETGLRSEEEEESTRMSSDMQNTPTFENNNSQILLRSNQNSPCDISQHSEKNYFQHNIVKSPKDFEDLFNPQIGLKHQSDRYKNLIERILQLLGFTMKKLSEYFVYENSNQGKPIQDYPPIFQFIRSILPIYWPIFNPEKMENFMKRLDECFSDYKYLSFQLIGAKLCSNCLFGIILLFIMKFINDSEIISIDFWPDYIMESKENEIEFKEMKQELGTSLDIIIEIVKRDLMPK